MKPEWIIDGQPYGSADLAAIADRVKPLKTVRRVLIQSADPRLYYAALASCENRDAFLFAVPHTMPKQAVRRIAESGEVGLVIEGDAETPQVSTPITDCDAGATGSGGICIFTTGTTARPKGVLHSWRTISASSRFVPGELAGVAWWLAYQLTSYAGLQVYFSARRSCGTLVVNSDRDPQAVAASIVQNNVAVISATPTYWRWLVQSWPIALEKPHLMRATLGGEIVTQQTIDLVKRAFQPERITHIYASSEAGTAIVVSDGLAGFPCSAAANAGGAEYSVQDGELFVRSSSQMAGYWDQDQGGDGWIATGDLVRERDGRYYFCGRADGRINAGGAKVNPERVEEALESLPMIRAALVYGKSSPIVGDLLAADVEWQGNAPFDAALVRTELATSLAAHEIPPYIRAVDRIAMSENGKKLRG